VKVTFMGLDFTHYNHAEGDHVTIDMPAPPAKGTRIVFNGGTVYVVSHDPEYFINTGTVPWNDEQHGEREGWIEACWVLVHPDQSPDAPQHSSRDPREGMSEKERARFDKQVAELMAEVMNRSEPDPNCPQCGRPCSTTVWRQDDCAPRGREWCYKSHDQMQQLRDMARGC
jgi:hypothetical protein